MFRMLRLVLALVVIAGFAGTTSAGDKNAWSIVQASGQIWIEPDGAERVSLGDTRTIEPGTTLGTSASGRILLQRGQETMVVGPNTIMQVPRGSSRLYTTVIELMGEIEFDVEKRHVRHFAVKTSYLAAVVKGTHFVVAADAQGGSVAVQRGVVEVEALSTGERRDIRPGQRAEVSRAGLVVLNDSEHAAAGSGGTSTASGLSQGGGLGDGDGLSAGLGGSNGVNASVGGGNGVSASVGGSGGIGVNAGGGNGVSVHIGGIGLGVGGH